MDAREYLAARHPQYVDWEITALFCSAYRLVRDRLRSMDAPEPKTHKSMRRQIEHRLPETAKPYETLLKLSWKARCVGRHSVSGYAKAASDCHDRMAAALNR